MSNNYTPYEEYLGWADFEGEGVHPRAMISSHLYDEVKQETVGKPITYYNLDYSNNLIWDIVETWGEYLQNLTISDQYWLIYTLTNHHLENLTFTKSEDVRPQDFVGNEAHEVVGRIEELNQDEVMQLIKALTNQSEPMGYWGLDSRKNKLLTDIRETWGDRLLKIDDIDQAFLVAELAKHFWTKWGGHPSNEAQEVFDRVDELAYSERAGLIQALVNK